MGFRMINFDSEKSKYIWGKKTLENYKERPRLYVEAGSLRYHFPYWEGDNLRKYHIWDFHRYCHDTTKREIENYSTDKRIKRYEVETTYYGWLKLKLLETCSSGKCIHVAIVKIDNWSPEKEIDEINMRFRLTNMRTGEKTLDNPSYYEKLIGALKFNEIKGE